MQSVVKNMYSVVLEKWWWRLRATHLRGLGLVVAVVGLAPVGALLALLLCLLGGSLSLAAGGELEVEVVALEVEASAHLVVHVDVLDVGLGEGLHGRDGVALGVGAGQSTLAGDGGREAAQVAQHHGVALGDGLLDAVAHVGDDANDGALAVDAVVVGHVSCEGVDVEHAVQLQTGVRLFGLVGMDGILLHVQRVLKSCLHCCGRPRWRPLSPLPPWGGGPRYARMAGAFVLRGVGPCAKCTSWNLSCVCFVFVGPL